MFLYISELILLLPSAVTPAMKTSQDSGSILVQVNKIMLLLRICQLHIHAANLPFPHIPKVLYWIEIWWLWRPLEHNELIVMSVEPAGDDCVLCDMVHYPAGSHKVSRLWPLRDSPGQQLYSGRLWHLKAAQFQLRRCLMCAKKTFFTVHLYHQPEPLTQDRVDPWIHVVYGKYWHYAADIEICQSRWHFSNLSLPSFGVSVPTVTSVSCY